MSGIDWSEFPYKTYVTDKDGELLPDGKLRLESGEIVDEDNQAYFDSVKSSVGNSIELATYPTDDGTTEVKEESYLKDIITQEDIKEKDVIDTKEPTSIDGGITVSANTQEQLPLGLTEFEFQDSREEAKRQSAYADLIKKQDKSISDATWSSLLPKRMSLSPSGMIFNMTKSFIENTSANQPIIGDKWTAMSHSWSNNTSAGKSLDYMMNDYRAFRGSLLSPLVGDRDKEWMNRDGKHEEVLQIIKDNNLPMNSYGRLMESVSIDHQEDLIDNFIEQKQRNKLIGDSYDMYRGGFSEANVAMGIVGLADIESLTLGAFGMLAKASKAKGIIEKPSMGWLPKSGKTSALLSSATNASLNRLVYDIDPNVSSGEAWAYWLMSNIDTPLIYRMGAEDFKPLYYSIKKMPSDSMRDRMYKDTLPRNLNLSTGASYNKSPIDEILSVGRSSQDVIDEIIDIEITSQRALTNNDVKLMLEAPKHDGVIIVPKPKTKIQGEYKGDTLQAVDRATGVVIPFERFIVGETRDATSGSFPFTGIHGGNYQWGEVPKDDPTMVSEYNLWKTENDSLFQELEKERAILDGKIKEVINDKNLSRAKQDRRIETLSSNVIKLEDKYNKHFDKQPEYKFVDRYGSVAGDDVTYIDTDGRWQSGEHGFHTESKKFLHAIQGELNKPLLINESTIDEVTSILKNLNLTSSGIGRAHDDFNELLTNNFKIELSKEGYDGIVINFKKDIDEFMHDDKLGSHLQAIHNDLGHPLSQLLQNQIILFNPLKSAKTVKTYPRGEVVPSDVAIELSKRRTIRNSREIKKVVGTVAKIKEELDMQGLTDKQRNRLNKQYHIEKQKVLDYDSSVNELLKARDELSKNVEFMGREAKLELQSSAKSFFEELYSKGGITDKEIAKVREGTSRNYPAIRLRKNKDGTYNAVSKKDGRVKIGNKIPAALGAAIAAATALEASDGVSATDIGFTVALATFLAIGFVGRKGIMKQFGSKIDDIKTQAENMDRTRGFRAKASAIGEESATRLTETLGPLLKDGSPEFVDAVKRFYFNARNGEIVNAESLKDMFYKSNWNILNRDIGIAYNSYRLENGIELLEKVANIFDYTNAVRYTFDRKVMEAIELGLHADIPSVQSAAKIIKDRRNSLFAELKESDMKYAHLPEEAVDTHMPRYKKPNLSVLLRSMTPDSYDSLVGAFAKTLTKAMANKKLGLSVEEVQLNTARTYLDFAKNPSYGITSMTSVMEIEALLKAKGLDGVIDANELADLVGVGADSWGRTKDRLYIDKSMFPSRGVEITSPEGGTMMMKMDDIFESSATQVMHQYIAELSGHLALADSGFETVGKAMEAASMAINPANRKIMEQDIQMIVGNSAIDMSSLENRIFADVKNLTLATKLPLSALSLVQEVVTTMQRVHGAAWVEPFVDNARHLLDAGQDSMMVQMMLATGRGTNRYGATYGGIKGIDEFGINTSNNGDGAIGQIFGKTGEMSRDFILNQGGLIKISDMLEAVNMSDTTKVFYDFIMGNIQLRNYEKITYGITPEFEQFLRGLNLELNAEGFVRAIDMDSLTRKERLKFLSVVDNMMQKKIQHARMGTTPAYFRHSMLGRVMGSLLSFPISAFTNIGSFHARGMMAGDPNAYMQSGLWFAGGAITAIMRWEIQGKDYDAEDILWASILSHPAMGFSSVGSAFANPAPMDTIQRFQEIYTIK